MMKASLPGGGGRLKFKKVTAFPATPELDTLYHNTTTKEFSYYDGTEWLTIGGGGGTTDLHFIIESDLDTISASITQEGPITIVSSQRSYELSGHSYLVKLDANTSYTACADVAALELWIATNVVSDTALWQIKVAGTYKSGYTGQASVLLTYEK